MNYILKLLNCKQNRNKQFDKQQFVEMMKAFDWATFLSELHRVSRMFRISDWLRVSAQQSVAQLSKSYEKHSKLSVSEKLSKQMLSSSVI